MVAGFVFPVSAQADAVNCTLSGTFTISGNTVTDSFNCNGKAVIPTGATSIAAQAFKNAEALTEVSFPSTLTSIGDQAFYQSGLLNVSIPDAVTTIGDNAFSGTALRSVTIGNGDTNIGNAAFQQNYYLSTVQIGTGAVRLGAQAFYNNNPRATSRITTFEGGSGITYIGEAAFFGSKLKSFTVPDSVTEIAGGAFHSNVELTSLNIGKGVTTMGENIFIIAPEFGEVSKLSTINYCGTNEVVLNYPYPNGVKPTCKNLNTDNNSAAAAAAAAQRQRELTEILSLVPSIAGLSTNISELTNSLLFKQKCVKGKKSKYVKYGAKCPKGYTKKK